MGTCSGSGGNDHAVSHYKETHYPLAVKLGTITPQGADVYSYEEDDMVEDPMLPQHLQHFGIDITSMTKVSCRDHTHTCSSHVVMILQTDVTMTELEIEMNMKIGEWSIIQESGKQLVPCHGPGYTGMENLGNSCYLNSIMQVLFSLPHFKQRSEVITLPYCVYHLLTCVIRYYNSSADTFQSAPPNPVNDLETQM